MMKHHRRSHLRLLGGATAVTLLAGITAALGTPVVAHPHPEGDEKGHGERIMIMTHKGGDGAEHSERRLRMRHGGGDEAAVAHCPDDQATRIDEGEGDERTRIVLCAPPESTPIQRVEHLQRARERLAEEDHLSAEQRARVTAALDREIARLQAQ